jgi:formylglycine-generating enzyme required for sulfatase activity
MIRGVVCAITYPNGANMAHIIRSLLTIALMCAFARGRGEILGGDARARCQDSPSGDRRQHNGKELLGPGFGEFIFIVGGEFTMGRNIGENNDERPEHRIELSSFFVGRTPVTIGQFVRFLNEARIKPDEYLCAQVPWAEAGIGLLDGKWVCTQGAGAGAACGESWILAERYCEWLSKKTGRKCRLPTEAEWEYVCRGKEGRTFPWGNNIDDVDSKTWRWRRSAKTTTVPTVPVGSFPKGTTPEGVCDLIGYMDEMCSDWYDPEYYAKSPRKNPKGPSEPRPYKNAKVTRGGLDRPYTSGPCIVRFFRDGKFFAFLPSWYLPRGWSRGKAVPPEKPDFVYGRLGFRVVIENEIASKDER